LLACTFLAGVAGAFLLVVISPFLMRNSTPQERTHLFSMNIVVSQATTVLGELLGGALPGWFAANTLLMDKLPRWSGPLLASQPEARSYQFALLLAGLIAAPSFIPLFLMDPDSPRPNPSHVEQSTPPIERTLAQEPLLSSSSVGEFTQGGIAAPNVHEVHPQSELTSRPDTTHLLVRSRQWLILAQKWLKSGNLRTFFRSAFFACTLVYILTGLGAGLLIPYFNLYFVRQLHASPALFGLLDGIANGLLAITTLLAPWLASRLGRINAIMLTRLLSLPMLLGIGFAHSLPVAAVLYPLREGSMDMAQGIFQVYAMEAVPTEHRGLANSTYQAVSQVFWAITASLAGLLIVAAGYGLLFIGTFGFYVASVLVIWGYFGKKREA
jgi:MFS family permease